MHSLKIVPSDTFPNRSYASRLVRASRDHTPASSALLTAGLAAADNTPSLASGNAQQPGIVAPVPFFASREFGSEGA